MRYARCLCCISLFLVVLCPRLSAQEISATVVDQQTGNAISSASIRVVDGRGTVAAHVFTDTSGTYVIPLAAVGRYALQVRAWGYDTRELGWLDVTAEAPLDLRLNLAPRYEEAVRLRGVVMDDSTRSPVGDASLFILDANGSMSRGTIADADGFFEMALPAVGEYALRIDASDFRTTVTHPFMVVEEQGINIEVRLSKEVATQLAGITVTGEAPVVEPLPIREFHQRRERGWGEFVTREQIELRNPHRFTDVVRMLPSVKVVRMPRQPGQPLSTHNHSTIRFKGVLSMSGDCIPTLFLDGMDMGPIDNAEEGGPDVLMYPSEIEGIEVYRPAVVPGRFSSFNSRCGVVVVWTKRST